MERRTPVFFFLKLTILVINRSSSFAKKELMNFVGTNGEEFGILWLFSVEQIKKWRRTPQHQHSTQMEKNSTHHTAFNTNGEELNPKLRIEKVAKCLVDR